MEPPGRARPHRHLGQAIVPWRPSWRPWRSSACLRPALCFPPSQPLRSPAKWQNLLQHAASTSPDSALPCAWMHASFHGSRSAGCSCLTEESAQDRFGPFCYLLRPRTGSPSAAALAQVGYLVQGVQAPRQRCLCGRRNAPDNSCRCTAEGTTAGLAVGLCRRSLRGKTSPRA